MTFRALDAETGEPLAVRRFFPFGVDGGGLFDEERTEYAAALARLAGLTHPGLRSVRSGGCDPVDGMPFVVTEWITGQALAEKLAHGVFSPAAAIRVLDRALEISEELSRVLGEEAVWVETSPALIIEDSGDSRRGLTFSISPMKWLGGETSRRSLLAIAELADDLLGWRGMIVADHAGNGLGSWVKWLRAHAHTITLFAARESLASFTGGSAPQPPRTSVQMAPRPLRLKKRSSKRPLLWLVALLAVAVVAAGWWTLKPTFDAAVDRVNQRAAAARLAAARKASAGGPATAERAAAPAKPEDSESTRLTTESTRMEETDAPAASLVHGGQQSQAADDSTQGRVFQSGDTQQIMKRKGRAVTVEGVLKNVRSSDSGKTLYLEFAETTAKEEVRGCIITKSVGEDMSEQALKPLLGKRIRISGVVRIMHYFKVSWPEVLLVERSSIQEVE